MVLKEVRPQPFPLTLDSIGQCCSLQDSPVDLAKCANSTKSMSRPAANVALVTYLAPEKGSTFDIPDILTFGSYMIADTAAYAEQNDYSFHWLNEDTGSNYQPGDARWNKVKIIDVALNPESGWAKDSSYFVWMDADAIVLDLGLKIEKIGEQYPSADFIASADIRQGYLNSGFLLMRNTPWLRAFVREWWDVVDRSVKCDQDAFDVLYERYLADYLSGKKDIGDVREKVAILERDSLNSDPPAMTHQQDYNQVVHLMGEITPQRKAAFSKAFSSICSALSSPDTPTLPNQLGVDRVFLLNTASEVYSTHVSQLIESAKKPGATVDEFNALSVACHHLSDIYITLGDEQSHKKYQALFGTVYNITIQWLKAFEAAHKDDTVDSTTQDLTVEYMYMLKRTAENGNDMFHSLEDVAQKKLVAADVLGFLDKLYELLHPQSKPFARHMSALMFHNLGDMIFTQYMQLQDQNSAEARALLEEGLVYEGRSAEYLKTFFDTTDNKSIMREYIQSLQLTAIFMCQLKDFKKAEPYWVTAISKSEALAAGVKIGNHYAALRGIYYNAGICNYQGKMYALAQQRLGKMLDIYAELGGFTSAVQDHPVDVQHAYHALKEMEQLNLLQPELLRGNGVDQDDEWEECVEGEEGCEEVEVFEDASGKITPVNRGTRVITADDLDEWEECSPGDPDCEEVEVEWDGDEAEEDEDESELAEIRAQYAAQSKRFNANSGQSSGSDEEEDDEDDDDEDEKELAEIRAQYAAQSKRFAK